MDRVKNIEQSQNAMRGKLSELFEGAKRLEERLANTEKNAIQTERKLEKLVAKIDGVVDKLLALEEISENIKKLAHRHKVIK